MMQGMRIRPAASVSERRMTTHCRIRAFVPRFRLRSGHASLRSARRECGNVMRDPFSSSDSRPGRAAIEMSVAALNARSSPTWVMPVLNSGRHR